MKRNEVCQNYKCDFFRAGKCYNKMLSCYAMQCVALRDKSLCEKSSEGCISCAKAQCSTGVSFTERLNKQRKAIAYVDGSFNKATNTYGYGVVFLWGDTEKHYKNSGNNEDTAKMYQIGGELLGASFAVSLATKLGIQELTIFYDYEGIEKWVTGDWKAKNDRTKAYQEFMRKTNLSLKFKHIKSHTGDKYNELADKLAKEAVGLNKG